MVRQIAYIHGRESILLEIDRERVTTHMEEEDHFIQTQLSAPRHCCIWQQGYCPWQLLPLSLFTYFSLVLFSAHSLTLFCSSLCLFIGNNGATTPALLQQWWLPKTMVGAAPTLAAAIVDGCCHPFTAH